MPVMSSNSQSFTQRRYIFDTRPTSSGIPVEQTVPSAIARQLVVGTPGVINGDFHTPYPHGFTINSQRNYEGTVGTQYSNGSVTQMGYQNSYPSHRPLPNGVANSVYNRCVDSLYSSVRGDLDLLVAAAEFSSTQRMLKSTTRFVDVARRFHPKNWGRSFLEYRYGWSPLINDVYSSLDQLVSPVKDGNRVYSRQESEKVRTWVRRPSAVWPFASENRIDFYSHRVKIVSGFNMDPSTALSAGNWTSLNPMSIAWELMPYSFVIDWFLDVGSYLRNLENTALFASRFNFGYFTTTTLINVQSIVSGSTTRSGSSITDFATLGGSSDYKLKSRASMGSNPMPRPPTVKPSLGAMRMLSAAALLSTFLGDKKLRKEYIRRTQTVAGKNFLPPTWDMFSEAASSNRNDFNTLKKRVRPQIGSDFWRQLKP